MIYQMPWETDEYAGYEDLVTGVKNRIDSEAAWANWFADQSSTAKALLELLSDQHVHAIYEAFDNACRERQAIVVESPEDVVELFGHPEPEIPMDGPDSAVDCNVYCPLCHEMIMEGMHECPLRLNKNPTDDKTFNKINAAHAAWRKRMKPEFDKIRAATQFGPETVTRQIK